MQVYSTTDFLNLTLQIPQCLPCMDFSDQAHERRKELRPSRGKQIQPKLDLCSFAFLFQNITIFETDGPHLSIHRQSMVELMLYNLILHFDFQQSEITQNALCGGTHFAKHAWRCLSEIGHVWDKAAVIFCCVQELKDMFQGSVHKYG